MLYVTTRNEYDAFTAFRTLGQGRGPDRGLFVPFQMPRLPQEEIAALKDKSFGHCVADILNLFFNARLDAWDVDFCIGRYPIRSVALTHKVIIGEGWHNPDFDFSTHTGFLPMRFTDGRFGGSGDFASGFGFYASECPKTESTANSSYEPTDFEKAVRNCRFVLNLRCSYNEPFAPLLAYLFGAYLVANLGGIFVDHREGQYYTHSRSIEVVIHQIISQLQNKCYTGTLLTHNFAGW